MIDTQRIRENILDASKASGHGHIPTSFSIVEMLVAAYGSMKHDPENPDMEDRDIFILSKGHAALGYYCVLAELGYFSKEELKTFGQAGSRLGCHPDRMKQPWVELSCGSLGHGIAVSIGMALAFKIRKNGRRVFVLIGDGESNEGSVWESVMIAADQKLDNLVILYDNNQSQTRCLQIHNPSEKFRAFGCEVAEVNGHSVDDISDAIAKKSEVEKPKVVVCNTVKGFGCDTLVNEVFAWHRRSPSEDELKQLRGELHA